MTRTPEQWLEEADGTNRVQGVLKLFLGYAAGVGKTYTMLSEALRRRSRGEDVVIGLVEAHNRTAIAELAGKIEAVPLQKVEYKGTVFEEMDTEAILQRQPQVVVVDELAHTNIPGVRHRKRYEDVLELLDARIDVLSAMNIQHMESIAPLVRSITGITVRETVPDWVVQSAAETVLVDLTPEALQNRMLRGDVYHPDKAGQALKNFFRRSNLIALRELALRQVAEQVDRSLEPYTQHEQKWMVRERIAVCVSSNPAAQYLIARGSRMARRLDAELYVVYVNTGKDEAADRQKSLAANLELATNLGARIERLSGNDVASAVAAFVREKHVTQVIFGRSAAKGWRRHLYMSAVHRFLRDAPTVDVHIVPQETD